MKVLDDLYKKETLLEAEAESNGDSGYYAKLKAYLLLLYQAYLKDGYRLEPEIKMAIWRMVSLQEDFTSKIEMAQQHYLDRELKIARTSWEDAKEDLFPMDDSQQEKPISKRRRKLMDDYKSEVLALLSEKP